MTAPQGHRLYHFGDCVLDPRRGVLLHGGKAVPLRPKSFAVLAHMVENAGRLVTKHELLDEVWGDTYVTEGSISQCLIDIRRAIGDYQRELIRTVPRRGFVLEMAVDVEACVTSAASTLPRTPSALPGGAPVIAVLPFDSLSDDPDTQYFSDGVSEEILQAVARTTDAKVIGRSSSFQFRGQDKSVRRVASELRCTHVLDGSVRRIQDRVRVSAQLIASADQITLWSGQFDRQIVDVFDLQDEVARAVAEALQVAFAPSPSRPIDPQAYDLYLRAKAATPQWLGAGDPALLEQSVALAPDFAAGWAALAVSLSIHSFVAQDAEAIVPLRERALDAARRAIELDQTAGPAYVALSILQPICGQFHERDRQIEKALTAAPNDPVVKFWTCRWRHTVGRLREALSHSSVLKDLDPLWPQGVHLHATMIWAMGRRNEAKALWDWMMQRWPDLYYLYGAQIGLAVASGDWARAEQVWKMMAEVLADSPNTEWARRVMRNMRGSKSAVARRLRTLIASAMDESPTLPLHLIIACNYGLADDVYRAMAQSDYSHLFTPTGRLHPEDFGLHILFTDNARDFRRDPRFANFCCRLGLGDYWIASNQWPDCVHEVAAHYDFEDRVHGAVSG